MITKEQATMEFEIDLHDDNLTVIRKQIELLRRQVRETGNPEAQEQLARKTPHDLGSDDACLQEMVSVDRAGNLELQLARP